MLREILYFNGQRRAAHPSTITAGRGDVIEIRAAAAPRPTPASRLQQAFMRVLIGGGHANKRLAERG